MQGYCSRSWRSLGLHYGFGLLLGRFSPPRAFPPSVWNIQVLRIYLWLLVVACLPLNFIHSQRVPRWVPFGCPSPSLPHARKLGTAAVTAHPQQGTQLARGAPERQTPRQPHLQWRQNAPVESLMRLQVSSKHPEVPGEQQSFSCK